MTDMYDDWDEDSDDINYRHQRRLSDPSANLNNYNRYGWKTKPTPSNEHSKALSQNEGLDSLINEVSEIEAGDLKDGKLSVIIAEYINLLFLIKFNNIIHIHIDHMHFVLFYFIDYVIQLIWFGLFLWVLP